MQQPANDTMWQEYKLNDNNAFRQQLIMRYSGLVKYVVRKMIKNFPQAIEEGDLHQIGVLGLLSVLIRLMA